MAFDKLDFSKDWTRAEDFPTLELDEGKVRADMQLLHNETRDTLNRLIDDLESGEKDTLVRWYDEGVRYLRLSGDGSALEVSKDGYEWFFIMGGGGSGSSNVSSDLTPGMTLIINEDGKIVAGEVTEEEQNFLKGVTSSIQTQLDGKAPSVHTHKASEVNSFPLIDARSAEYDMDAILKGGIHFGIYRINGSTLGTPAKYGKSVFNFGFIISTAASVYLGKQVAILSGGICLLERRMYNGTIEDWQFIYSTGYKPTAAQLGWAYKKTLAYEGTFKTTSKDAASLGRVELDGGYHLGVVYEMQINTATITGHSTDGYLSGYALNIGEKEHLYLGTNGPAVATIEPGTRTWTDWEAAPPGINESLDVVWKYNPRNWDSDEKNYGKATAVNINVKIKAYYIDLA